LGVNPGDAADRARDGAAAAWRPQRHRGLFAVGCSSLGTFSTRFTELVGMPPSAYRRHAASATAGMPPCVAKQVTSRSGIEKRGHRTAANVTVIDITIHLTFTEVLRNG
jgi:hypothetical protein